MNFDDATDNAAASPFIPIARPVRVDPIQTARPLHPMLLLDESPGAAAQDLVVIVLLAVLAELGFGRLLDSGAVSWISVDPRVPAVVLAIVRGFVLVGFIGVLVRKRRQSAASLGLCSERWWITAAFSIVATVGAYVAMAGVIGAMFLIYRDGFDALQKNPERIAEAIPHLHPLLLCGIGMLVGFYEELIFRGFLLTRLRRLTGSGVVAVLVSSTLFAAPHAFSQEVVAVIPIFVLGVLWGGLTLWRKSIIPAIVGHAMFDLINLVSQYYLNPSWE